MERQKKKTGLRLIILIFLVLILSVGIFLFFKLPSYIVNKAIDENNISEVIKWYPYVYLGSDKEHVKEEMMQYVQNTVYDNFLNGNCDYDEAISQMDELRLILGDEKSYKKMYELIDEMDESHKAYLRGMDYMSEYDFISACDSFECVLSDDVLYYNSAKENEEKCLIIIGSGEAYALAEEYMENMEYEMAIQEYEKVVPEDELHYDDAVIKIGECEELLEKLASMNGDETLIGTWHTVVDAGGYVEEETGFYGYGITLPISVDVTFTEDGCATIYCYLTENQENMFLSSLREPALDMAADEFGVDADLVELYCGLSGTTLEEMISDYVGDYLEGTVYENIFSEGYSQSFDYSFDENIIYCMQEPYFEYEMDGGYITATFVGTDIDFAAILTEEIKFIKIIENY